MKYQVSFATGFKRNPYPGKFIAIEGIDGSGKTTQVEKISQRLKNSGRSVFMTKEPTRGVVGQLIRKVIQKEVKLPKLSLQYLFGADRAVHLEEVIIPKLKEGVVIISDRYFWSSVAYGLADIDGLRNTERLLVAQSILSFYHQFLLPDFTFYLDISVEIALTRISGRHREKGREYYEEKEKLEKIVKGYDWLVKKFPKEITVIDGEQSVNKVTEEILNKLLKSLK